MRVVVASDSFKGSLSAAQACAAIGDGIRRVRPEAEIIAKPMADGGEGTLEALACSWDVEPQQVASRDAIGRSASGAYVLRDGVAIVELATTDGLPAVSDRPLRPRQASTRGTGRVLRAALEAGARKVLLCAGGSASTDGGAGILQELGVRLLDDSGNEIGDGGAGLATVSRVDSKGLLPQARAARWRIAVDVTNPLTGPEGAAAVFGPQKGADPAGVAFLDAALTRWTEVLAASGYHVPDLPGMGAAGGLPAGLTTVLNAALEPGAKLVGEAIGLREACCGAAIVFTGEGRFDAQSLGGKVVAEVVREARTVPVVVLAGQVAIAAEDYRAAGVRAAFSIASGPGELVRLQQDAGVLLCEAAAAVGGLLFG